MHLCKRKRSDRNFSNCYEGQIEMIACSHLERLQDSTSILSHTSNPRKQRRLIAQWIVMKPSRGREGLDSMAGLFITVSWCRVMSYEQICEHLGTKACIMIDSPEHIADSAALQTSHRPSLSALHTLISSLSTPNSTSFYNNTTALSKIDEKKRMRKCNDLFQ